MLGEQVLQGSTFLLVGGFHGEKELVQVCLVFFSASYHES